jgi:hypothetical protein
MNNNPTPLRLLLFGAVVFACIASAAGQTPTPPGGAPTTADQKPDKAQTPDVKQSYDMVMAPPIAMFLSLTQLGLDEKDWQKAGLKTAVKVADQDYPKSPHTALLFGIKLADAALAAYSKDQEAVNGMSPAIFKMAKALGATQPEIDQGLTVSGDILAGRYLQAIAKLTVVDISVVDQLKESKNDEDKALAQLIAIGGYLEGLRIVSAAILDKYDASETTVFRQGKLCQSISQTISSLPADVQSDPGVAAIIKVMPDLTKLVDKTRDGTFTQDEVGQINTLVDQTIQVIIK